MDSEHKDSESQITGNKRSTLFTVCPFILGNEFCERLAFYGLATNMVTYITKVMNGGSAYAAVQLSMFEGTCYLTPLLGAWLADSMLGRYKTILLSSAIYLVGMVMLAISSAVPPFKPSPDTDTTAIQNIALYSSLYIVAIGTGGIKPNVSAFGADQFDEYDPQDRKEKASFFNWFYFSINIGSLIAATVIVWVQDNISWTVGFLIPAVAMCMAVVSFVAGSSLYKHMPPTESPVARVVKVVKAAISNSWARRWQAGAPETEFLLPQSADSSAHGGNAYIGADLSTLAARTPPLTTSRSYAWLDAAINNDRSSSGGLLMGATASGFTRKQVEEVKMVLRLLPIFFTTIAYWAIYMQMGSFFVQQGNIMVNEVKLGSWQFAVPSASMSSFNTISIIVLIPLWDRWLEPALTRVRGGRKMTLLQKIGWGMVITIVAMLAAAAVEYKRLSIFWAGHDHSSTGAQGLDAAAVEPERVALNILWQAPQYFLVGASEVLASVGQLEFFYDQAPDVMRSCCMALQLLSTALGSYLAGALVLAAKSITASVSQDWLPRDLNYGHLDTYFLALAVMMALNLLAFIWVSLSYEYKAVTHIRPTPDLPPVTESIEPPTSPTAPTPPLSSRSSAPLVIGRHPRHPVDPQDDPYGRSLAFQPYSPALPAPFR